MTTPDGTDDRLTDAAPPSEVLVANVFEQEPLGDTYAHVDQLPKAPKATFPPPSAPEESDNEHLEPVEDIHAHGPALKAENDERETALEAYYAGQATALSGPVQLETPLEVNPYAATPDENEPAPAEILQCTPADTTEVVDSPPQELPPTDTTADDLEEALLPYFDNHHQQQQEALPSGNPPAPETVTNATLADDGVTPSSPQAVVVQEGQPAVDTLEEIMASYPQRAVAQSSQKKEQDLAAAFKPLDFHLDTNNHPETDPDTMDGIQAVDEEPRQLVLESAASMVVDDPAPAEMESMLMEDVDTVAGQVGLGPEVEAWFEAFSEEHGIGLDPVAAESDVSEDMEMSEDDDQNGTATDDVIMTEEEVVAHDLEVLEDVDMSEQQHHQQQATTAAPETCDDVVMSGGEVIDEEENVEMDEARIATQGDDNDEAMVDIPPSVFVNPFSKVPYVPQQQSYWEEPGMAAVKGKGVARADDPQFIQPPDAAVSRPAASQAATPNPPPSSSLGQDEAGRSRIGALLGAISDAPVPSPSTANRQPPPLHSSLVWHPTPPTYYNHHHVASPHPQQRSVPSSSSALAPFDDQIIKVKKHRSAGKAKAEKDALAAIISAAAPPVSRGTKRKRRDFDPHGDKALAERVDLLKRKCRGE